MKILYVHGDSDYATVDFADTAIGKMNHKDVWEIAWDSPNHVHTIHFSDYDPNDPEYEPSEDDTEIYIEALKFDEVDPFFIHFIKDKFIDYDVSKAQDFYVVEEK